MRLARIGSVPALVRGDRWVHVAVADRVDDPPAQPLAGVRLQAPRNTPRQVFGAALNYRSHLADASRPVPDMPQFFMKFPTCVRGPTDEVVVATDAVDFEAQLVVVIGHAGRPGATGRGWGPRRRAHRRPGQQRRRRAALGTAQPGKLVPHRHADRTLDHHARRGPRPRRHPVHPQHQRGDAPARPRWCSTSPTCRLCSPP